MIKLGLPPSPIDWLRALNPSTMLGTLSRFDKLKALSQSMGLPNGLVETAKAAADKAAQFAVGRL